MEDAIESNKNICTGCGAENPESSKFCVECGQKIKPEVETEKICINCGFKNDATAKFCGNCGNDLSLEKIQETASFENPIRGRSVTDQKGFTHKVLSDVKNEAKKAKKELENAIEDYTLDIPVDIRETADSLIVNVELPQVKREDINMDITPLNINIKARFDHEVEVKQGTQINRVEVRKGQLNKNIKLPKQVIPERTVADFENYILTLKLIKKTAGSSHSITL
jgi:HSP20 family protein